MPRPGRRQAGFTLLEVLVALIVLGLLMAGLTAGVRAGLSIRQKQAQRLAATADLDATERAVRTILAGIAVTPSGNRVVADANGGLFRGAADRVSFVGDLPTGLGPTRRADMSLTLVDGQFVLYWTPHRHERALTAPTPAHETVLVSGVEAVEFSYWGAPARGQPAGWQTQWESPQAPELVRLRLGFRRGDRRRWPDLIAAVRH
jgi:general secretion pathway protein J